MSKLKCLTAFILAAITAITTGFSANKIKKDLQPKTVYLTAEPEIIYLTKVETRVVTEVVTEVITEVEYITEYVEPSDYKELCAYYYDEKINESMYLDTLMEKYPIATQIWIYLTQEMNLNNYVAAGIMGNLMNECGGNTLTLHPEWKVNGFVGICMWYLNYAPELKKDCSLEAQLDYLKNSIEKEFKTWGKLYKVGFTYEDFCNLSSCTEAAEAFMKIYERPSPASLNKRKVNALEAYATFVR